MEFKTKVLKVDNLVSKNGKNFDIIYFVLPSGLSCHITVFDPAIVRRYHVGSEITLTIDCDRDFNAIVVVKQ